MADNVLEFYQQKIRPLSEQERLELMALIASDLARSQPIEDREVKGGQRLSDLFGSAALGYPTGLDNERIDEELAREYANSHEGES